MYCICLTYKYSHSVQFKIISAVSECNKGTFGLNCTKTCNGCIVNECNHINGVCKIDSVCKPGYVYGKYCNESKCD